MPGTCTPSLASSAAPAFAGLPHVPSGPSQAGGVVGRVRSLRSRSCPVSRVPCPVSRDACSGVPWCLLLRVPGQAVQLEPDTRLSSIPSVAPAKAQSVSFRVMGVATPWALGSSGTSSVTAHAAHHVRQSTRHACAPFFSGRHAGRPQPAGLARVLFFSDVAPRPRAWSRSTVPSSRRSSRSPDNVTRRRRECDEADDPPVYAELPSRGQREGDGDRRERNDRHCPRRCGGRGGGGPGSPWLTCYRRPIETFEIPCEHR